MTVRNTTIASNSASLAGAFLSWGGPNNTTFDHVTVAGNRGGSRGVGGIGYDPADTVRLSATIVDRNSATAGAQNCDRAVTSSGHNLESATECGFTAPGDRQNVDTRLSEGLADLGGDTEVWPFAPDSPAINLIPACDGDDQRGVPRPQGTGCDSGAYEYDPVQILMGPAGPTNDDGPTTWIFTGPQGANYSCHLSPVTDINSCSAPSYQYEGSLADGDYVFRLAGNVDGTPVGHVERRFTVDTKAPEAPAITSPKSGDTVSSVLLRGTAEPGARIGVREGNEEFNQTTADTTGAWKYEIPAVPQGVHNYAVRAIDAAGNHSPETGITLTVDEPPVATITKGPPDVTNDVHVVYEFTSDTPGARFQCRDYIPDDEPSTTWVDCSSPLTLRDLTEGVHIFEVRAVDAAGVAGEPATDSFRVDVTDPEPPTITDPEDGTVVREGSVTLYGTTEPLTAVDVYDNGTKLGSAMIITEGNGGWFYEVPQLSEGTHVFTAVTIDDAGNASTPSAPVTVYKHSTGPTVAVDGPRMTNDETPAFALNANEPGVTFECALGSGEPAACGSPVTLGPLGDGDYTLTVWPIGADGVRGEEVTHSFTVDRTPPPAPQVSGTPTGDSAVFAIASDEAGVTLLCRLEGPGQTADFGPCEPQQTYSGLAPGAYRFVVRASDGAGNFSETVREFTVSQVNPQITPTPTPTSTPTPQPEFQETAVGRRVSGKVLVRRPGTTDFIELDGSQSIPMGSTVDAKRGRVRITAETQNGKPAQRAEFYDGIFRITQPGTIVDLRLVEQLAPCPRRASAAQARKPKKRKLWGSGKGRFRTTGQYSAATVRGTKWLVQDTCAGTLTQVTEGVVAVRDKRLRKTILVRKGKRYLALARR